MNIEHGLGNSFKCVWYFTMFPPEHNFDSRLAMLQL